MNFLVLYKCPKQTGLMDPVIRAVVSTDVINAIIAARQEERTLTGVNCPECVLARVTPA